MPCPTLVRRLGTYWRRPRPPWVWGLRGLTLVLLVAVLATFRRPLFTGNFGVVEPGRVYRSAQPGGNLRKLIRERKLATVLNLRGGSQADPWYSHEAHVTQEQGVAFYDLPISATRRPSRRELLLLLNLLEDCPYPLLVHCKWGSDRTGLVCALHLLAGRGESPRQALSAFSLGYGHFPIGGPEHLHEPFLEYDAWLRQGRLSHTPALFRDWVEHVYQSEEPETPLPELRPGPRPQVSTRTTASDPR